ncbi:MAG: methionyl-tRNA formyltransferase [Heliobacteriaceae bacterium]|jgi:methionyl-tRNA formyltransferase|nr:methionyl-tRNA formyltransferase [Heliobacteriaceae bacterium]
MKAVIIGKGLMLANIIEGVIDAGYEIAGVFRQERAQLSPFKLFFQDFFKSSPVYTLIKEYKIPEIKCKSVNSDAFKKELLRLNVDVLIVATWHEKLKKEITDLPVIASINAHPSLLPAYRGPNPYLETIRHLETRSGITFHLLDENYDSGPVLAQQKIDILPNYTGKELREHTAYHARLLTAEVLKKLECGLIIPVPQDESKASYYPAINPLDMILDFENKTARELHAQIRAFHPWYPCYVKHNGRYFIPNPYKLRITESGCAEPGKVSDIKNRSITVVCKDGKALKMDGVKVRT